MLQQFTNTEGSGGFLKSLAQVWVIGDEVVMSARCGNQQVNGGDEVVISARCGNQQTGDVERWVGGVLDVTVALHMQ